MSSVTSLIILAMDSGKNASIMDISKYVRENGEDQAINLRRVISMVRYHMNELMDLGIAEKETRGKWVKYYLSGNVEILEGKMVSGKNGDIEHSDSVGRIMRMTTEDGDAIIRLLDMM